MDVVGAGPKDGRAVKEMFFTSKPGVLYAIVPVRPSAKLVVRDVKPAGNVKVSMLGRDGQLKWKIEDLESHYPTSWCVVIDYLVDAARQPCKQ